MIFSNWLFSRWEEIVIGFATSLLSTGLIVLLSIKLLKVPSLNLVTHFMPKRETQKGESLPVLDIMVFNKKFFVGFGPQEVNFRLFFEESFIKDKTLFLITLEGQKEWVRDLRGANEVFVDGQKYYQFRGMIHLPLHLRTKVHFLRIGGNFIENTTRILYVLETPSGRVPRWIVQGEIMECAEKNQLPAVNVRLDNDQPSR